MASILEETEIKIEYIESNDTDPLCGNVSPTSYCDPTNIICDTVLAHNLKEEITSYENNLDEDSPEPTSFIKNIRNKKVTEKKIGYPSVDSDGRLSCEYCDLTYASVQTLHCHVKKKHPNKANKMKDVIKTRRRHRCKCHICKQHFKCLSELKNHVNLFHSLELIKLSCLYCQALFCNNNDLQNHMSVQHNAKHLNIFLCQMCGYQTASKYHYNQHLNIHIDSKEFKCQYCDYATNYSYNFKAHQQVHSHFKPYECSDKDCLHKSASKSALKNHELKHDSGKNVLICEQCCFVTAYKKTLKRHLLSHSRKQQANNR